MVNLEDERAVQLASRSTAASNPYMEIIIPPTASHNKGSDEDSPIPTTIRRPRAVVVGQLGPEARLARKKVQHDAELARIESEGVVFDRCSYCATAHKLCRIVIALRARQRTFNCLECFRRSKRCSHGDPGSMFRKALAEMQEEEDLKAGSWAARKRKQQRDEEEEAEKERKLERAREDADTLKRRELEVRADEAATRREMIRGQLRLSELENQEPRDTARLRAHSPLFVEKGRLAEIFHLDYEFLRSILDRHSYNSVCCGDRKLAEATRKIMRSWLKV